MSSHPPLLLLKGVWERKEVRKQYCLQYNNEVRMVEFCRKGSSVSGMLPLSTLADMDVCNI